MVKSTKPTKRLSCSLDCKLYQNLVDFAENNGMTLCSVLSRALKLYLSNVDLIQAAAK